MLAEEARKFTIHAREVLRLRPPLSKMIHTSLTNIPYASEDTVKDKPRWNECEENLKE